MARWLGRGIAAALVLVLVGVAVVHFGGGRGSADASVPDTWHVVDDNDPVTPDTPEPDFEPNVSSRLNGGATYDVAFTLGSGGDVGLRGVVLIEDATPVYVGGPHLLDLFELPCDYRPTSNAIISVTATDGSSASPQLLQVSSSGMVSLLADGSIVHSSPSLISATVSLDGIRFQPDGSTC